MVPGRFGGHATRVMRIPWAQNGSLEPIHFRVICGGGVSVRSLFATLDPKKMVPNEMQAVHAALPKPLMNGMAPMRFVDVQAMFDPLLPPGMQWYWKGDYVTELTDAAIAAHVEHGSKDAQ